MRRMIQTTISIVIATFLTVSGIIPLEKIAGVPSAKAVGEVYNGNGITDTTVYGGQCDKDYSQTHGSGVQYRSDWDSRGYLTAIGNGDKALYHSVQIGTDYQMLKGIMFRYAKPHNYNVTVRIRLDSEGGSILGDFILNQQTASLTDYTTQTFTSFNLNNVHGTHDLYLEFSTSYSIPSTNTSALDLDCMILGATNDYTEYSPYDPYDDNTGWNPEYKNETNKNKPYYAANPIYKRPAMILVRHKNTFGACRFVFANPHAVEKHRANICKIDGLSYNYKNNTLTLNNFNGKDYQIVCQNMGKSFKIKLAGKNKVQHLECWGNFWPCGMKITGSGSIEINKNKEAQNGLYLVSWFKNSLQIDSKAKVTAYAPKKSYPVVLEYGEGAPSKSKAAVIKFSNKKKKLKGKFINGPKNGLTKLYVYNKTKFEKK